MSPSRSPARASLVSRLPWALPLLTAVACGGGGGGKGGQGVGYAPLSISTTSLPGAAWNVPYSAACTAVGGQGAYEWSLAPGSALPSGVLFDASGVFSGTPTTVGTYPLTVEVSDLGSPQSVVSQALALSVGVDVPDLVATPGAARGTVVLDFTAPAAVNGPTTAYEIRASVRHMETAADLAAATLVPNSVVPAAPGAHETIPLSGLDPGQTLYFAVLPIQSGVPAAFTYAVASRVAEGQWPAPPGGAVPLSGPAAISTAGYYYLTGDVSAAGTAFSISASNVTLDLQGRTVTFGTGLGGSFYGVRVSGASGTVEIRNGTIRQGAGGGGSCSGIEVDSPLNLRLTGLSVTVHGPDADGIAVWSPRGNVRIDHATVRCDTTVVSNRHWPGVAAVRVDGGTGGSFEIDHVRVLSSPQWGIRIEGDAASGPVLLHHNVFRGTKALVANGYMLGVHKPNSDVFENDLDGESRGVHVESTGSQGVECSVHDNVIRVQDQPNPEYPDYHWVHGIKVEGGRGAKVRDNVVTGVADDLHAEVRAIDVTLENSGFGDVTGVEILRNRVLAQATTSTYPAYAFHWSLGTSGPNDLLVRHNVFTATDGFAMHYWDGGRGAVFRDCAFARDLSQGAGHAFRFEDFQNGGYPSLGHGVRDPIGTEDPNAVTQYGDAQPWDATREWTLSVRVVDGGGAPVEGASVTVEDKTGAPVASATTDGDGRIAGPIVVGRLTNGPTLSNRGPHVVRVQKSGFGAFSRSLSIAGRTALRVDLTASTSTLDTTPPAAPASVLANALSASRVLLRWTAPADDSGISAYLVTVDGVLAGVTDQARFVVPGLPASSAHTFGVRAVDLGGNVSGETTVAATTRPEDRGP